MNLIYNIQEEGDYSSGEHGGVIHEINIPSLVIYNYKLKCNDSTCDGIEVVMKEEIRSICENTPLR
jgi:hypothetical protein